MGMRAIMVGGTTSSAGKSLLTMALCRILAKKGYEVAPFKAQNMSLNSFVTKKGKEIAIAQAMQAFAAGIEPDERMNPILLKPKGNFVSQLVVLGEAVGDIDSREYYKKIPELKKVVENAYDSLLEEYEIILIEGAGGMAEINLYDRDLANVHIARYAKPTIVIVGDIDRGGVFASLYGTYKLLPEDLRNMVVGFVINRLRGYEEFLGNGIKKIEELCNVPVLGVIPFLDSEFPSEDSLNIEEWKGSGLIGIVRLPRISNFTDFEPLRKISSFVELNETPECEIIILPGSKDTIADLKALKSAKLFEHIRKIAGKKLIIGICGGYQMLGKELVDYGVEHGFERVKGLGLLEAETRFEEYKKITVQVSKKVTGDAELIRSIKGETVWGYEIHKGITFSKKPIFEDDGCQSDDGMCWGTYLHGLFWNENLLRAVEKYLGVKLEFSNKFDLLAEEFEKRLKISNLLSKISVS
ncbi:MAG: cobyric acid synthase CobQ [Archaeoglobaceae archaeon]|nr:cobyric acid synthase CobQ [Archaeoglobaceae archaeon]MDW8117515.1 cobyric acid synthase CobQ [Archaeoglobaceae archaeon]